MWAIDASVVNVARAELRVLTSPPSMDSDTTDSELEGTGQSGETERPGGVAERSKALVLKTREVRASQGSNPCPSAKSRNNLLF